MTAKDFKKPEWTKKIAKELAKKEKVSMTWREWKEDIPSEEEARNAVWHEKRDTAFETYIRPALVIAGIVPSSRRC
jgi:hypothetical protein